MSFKLGDIHDLQSAEIELLHPRTKAPLGAFVTMAGPEHPHRRALALKHAKRLREAFARTGKFRLDDEDDAGNDLEVLVAVTLGWRIEGAPAFSAEACRALYADPQQQWIVRQVRGVLEDMDRFIGDSATS